MICWALWLLFGAGAAAGDWPGFRGPDRDGVAVGESLADAWPADGPPVLWSREIGQGYSGFAIAGPRAVTQTQTLYEQRLLCLHRDTGDVIWSTRIDWPYDGGGLYPGPRATPTIAQGKVYFVSAAGKTGCVDLDTGQIIWSRDFKQEYRGRGTDFGVSASPVVWRDRVYIPVGGPDASLIAVEAATGTELWRCGVQPASYATPVVVPWKERWLTIAPLENSLLCADAETGEKHWELTLSTAYHEHSCAPIYREPFLLLASPFRSGAECWQLVRDEETGFSRPERAWQSKQFSNDVASSVLVDDLLLGFDMKEMQAKLHRPSRGEFRCLDWLTGDVLWSSTVPGHANVIIADGQLLLFNDRGELQQARVDRTGYHLLKSVQVFPETVSWTAPALSEGRIILRAGLQAVCLYVGRKPLSSTSPVGRVAEIPLSRAWNSAALLNGEREFPATAPDDAELRPWYLWSIAGLFGAWLLSLPGDIRFLRPRRLEDVDATRPSSRPERLVSRGDLVFLLFSLAWGLTGSWVLNQNSAEFVFTWPLALWTLLHAVVLTANQAILHPESRSAHWAARASLVLLIAACAIYFHFCRRLGMALEWIYLATFVIALPISWAGCLTACHWPRWQSMIRLLSAMVSYSFYFWGTSRVLNAWD